MDTADLLQRCLDGDPTAIEALILKLQGRVYNLAVRFLWDPLDAEDATQEILLRVIQQLGTFRGDSALETWVHRIAVNHLLNLKRRTVESLTYEEGSEHLARASQYPEYDGLDRNLLAEEVKISCTTSMLICLSRHLRIAYILGVIFELDSQEAAYILGISPVTFRKRLSLARTQLRAFMETHCGLYNPENPCRCTKKIGYDVEIGRMTPGQLRFADRGQASTLLDQVERLRDDITLMRSHPDYHAPERLLQAIKRLIDQRGIDQP
jgi:RNA polymerase sigma factor (sigma-70 family)